MYYFLTAICFLAVGLIVGRKLTRRPPIIPEIPSIDATKPIPRQEGWPPVATCFGYTSDIKWLASQRQVQSMILDAVKRSRSTY